MRISTSQIYNNLLSGIQNQMEIQDRGNTQIASGTRFQTPAEAGLDYKLSLDIRHAQTGTQDSINAITTAESRLGASQTALADMGNIMTRAEALAVQQSNAGLTPQQRESAAIEVGHLIDRFVANANQTWNGQSLFGGTAVDRPAFTQDALGSYVYNGSADDRMITVTSTQQVASNVRGDGPGFIDSINALQNFQTALQANDVPAIQSSLGTLTTASENVITLSSEVGGRLSYLQSYRNSFEDMKLHLDKQLNTHEAVDIAAVITELEQSNITLQASYSQIAQLKSLSLVNYL